MLHIGQTFADRYRVERRIAGGGMGAVYEVTDLNTDRRCALKVMLPDLANDRRLRERFALEARIPGRAESDHIVQVMDAGLDPASNQLFLVMELLRGEDLAQKIERQKGLSTSEALICVRQLASALEKTHALGIIHRDLKPQNLFCARRDDGTPHLKILDFGISKVLQETSVNRQRTEVLGSPQYMAPEQFAGEIPTPATDIFALGMIAYTTLVGESYWAPEASRFDNPLAFAMHATKGVQESAVQRALRAGKQLPATFDEWFFRITHRLPGQRHGSASEAVRALASVLEDGERPASPPATPAAATLALPANLDPDTMTPTESSRPAGVMRPRWPSNRATKVGAGVLAGLGALVAVFQLNGNPPPETTELAPTGSGAPTEPAPTGSGTPKPAPLAEPTTSAVQALLTADTDSASSAKETATPPPTNQNQLLGSSPPASTVKVPPVKPAREASVKPTSAPPPPPPPPPPSTRCVYELVSGKIVKYDPNSKSHQKPFACRKNTSGAYTEVP